MDKLPDWITAVATGLTAIAAIGAGTIAWLGYRRFGLPALPVIEPRFKWMDYQSAGRTIQFDIVARNQLYETVALESIKIVRPRGMTFATEKQQEIPSSDDFHVVAADKTRIRIVNRIETKFEKTSDTARSLEWEIPPVGTMATKFAGTDFQLSSRTDVQHRIFYLSPPRHWNGGTVELELRLLSKALTIRPRRITIKRQIPAAPKTQSDEKAK